MKAVWVLSIGLLLACAGNARARFDGSVVPTGPTAVESSARFRLHYVDESELSDGDLKLSSLENGASSEQQNEVTGERSDTEDGAVNRFNKSAGGAFWQRKPIQSLRVDIRESNAIVPADRSAELDYGHGDWVHCFGTAKVFAWAAPNIRYQPLYFEDVPLERYGQTHGLIAQPIRSGIHFYTSCLLLPYHMYRDPVHSCDYPLGYCRPGSCVPAVRQHQLYK